MRWNQLRLPIIVDDQPAYRVGWENGAQGISHAFLHRFEMGYDIEIKGPAYAVLHSDAI